MEKHYVQEEGITFESTFDTKQFGDLEIVSALSAIKESDKIPAWVTGTGGSICKSGPVIYKGAVYVGACDHIFYAVSIETGEEMWRFKTGDVIISPPTIYKDVVYFGSHDFKLYALDLNGNELWNFSANGPIAASPIVSNDTVCVGSKDGNMYALSTKGKLLWKFGTSEPISEAACIAKGKVFFGSWDHNLYTVDLKTGELLWKFGTNGIVGSTPVADDKNIYFGSFDHNIYALDMETGEVVWKFTTNGGVRKATLRDGVLYFPSRDNCVYAVTVKGKFLWKFKTGHFASQPPAIKGNSVYFGAPDYNFYAVDKRNGKLLWKFATKGPIANTPAIVDEIVVFGSMDCHLYALSTNGKVKWKFKTSLSNMSPIDVESMESGPGTHEIVWEHAAKEEKKKYESDVDIADYGEFSGKYIDVGKSDYLGIKKKGYLKR